MIRRAPTVVLAAALLIALSLGSAAWAQTLRWDLPNAEILRMSMVTMNLDTWKALPPDLQEAVLAAAAATSERQWAEIVNRVSTNYERMRGKGIAIVTDLSPEYQAALRAAGQVAIDNWLAVMGPAGKDILDRYRQRP
jgi:TRAP-type C4-dicarboxylate transport system substrate-binding protein